MDVVGIVLLVLGCLSIPWVSGCLAGWYISRRDSIRHPEPYWPVEPFSWRILLGPWHYYGHFYP